jgi:hypothetical protein
MIIHNTANGVYDESMYSYIQYSYQNIYVDQSIHNKDRRLWTTKAGKCVKGEPWDGACVEDSYGQSGVMAGERRDMGGCEHSASRVNTSA